MTWIAGQQLPCYVCAAASNMTPDDKYSNQIIIPCPSSILIFLQTFYKYKDVLVHQVSHSRSTDMKRKIKVFWALANDWALFHILRPWDHNKAIPILKSSQFYFALAHYTIFHQKCKKYWHFKGGKTTTVTKNLQ